MASTYERIVGNIVGGQCWAYRGRHQVGGYPRVRDRGRRVFVYKVVYEELVGPIPEGTVLDHLCRNPGCVNPEHLEPVTQRENVRRGIGPTAINARRTHCVNGHAFTALNTDWRDGHRHCRECVEPRLRGPNLTRAEADEIRRRYLAGGITQKALGSEYGVSQACVSDIVRGRTWPA